jgi:hypothetical protein
MTRASSLLPGNHLPEDELERRLLPSSTARVTTPRSTELGAPELAVGAAVSRLATHSLRVGIIRTVLLSVCRLLPQSAQPALAIGG